MFARPPLRLMAGLRAFSASAPRASPSTSPSSSSTAKIPTLGDITHSPAGSAAFKDRLESFRSNLAAQKAAASSAAAAVSAASSGASGSPPADGKGGIVKSILYGSEKGQREEAEMEQSYSKVLARGKYMHTIELHHVKPDKHAQYVELVGAVYPRVAAEKANNCHLVGSWKAEIGDPDTFGFFPPPPHRPCFLPFAFPP